MKHCIIVGAGTYGQVYAEYLKEFYSIKGFVDDNTELLGNRFKDIEVLGDISFLYTYLKQYPKTSIFVPIGNNKLRESLLDNFYTAGYDVPSFIHPQTIIHPSVSLGRAVYILPGTNIMPDTEIGDYVMISMGVNIAHHNKIGRASFYSQGTNIGASINICERAYFGIGSTLMTGVKVVGREALIGAGAVIIKDLPDNAVAVGNPGKIIKYN